MPATMPALVDADLLKLSPTVASRAVERDVRVARAFLSELSERARNFVYEIPGSVFATVPQRVARHLLDLASERAPESALGHEVGQGLTVSQQESAEAVGTVREVILRVVRRARCDRRHCWLGERCF